MLTALLLLSALQSPSPRPVEHPALALPVPDWAFIVRDEATAVTDSSPIPWAYSVGVDPAVPVESSEVEADIYQEEMP